ncbi:hypothetical protein WJX82_000463 [Trebouxia sp. C0006]
MKATSRRRAYFANRMCCRKPTVLGDQPEHLSSSAVNNQQKTSGIVLQHLARMLNGFGSKKPLTSERVLPAASEKPQQQGTQGKLHSGGTSQAYADAKIFLEAAEAKVLRAEEDASRLAASFMMKAAVTKALHESKQASRRLMLWPWLGQQSSSWKRIISKHSFETQNFRSQHCFAFKSSEAHHKSQLQATLAEHAAATLRTRQHESEVEALRSQLEAQAQRALAESQEQHDAAMSACQARLDSAHVTSLKAEHEATIGKYEATDCAAKDVCESEAKLRKKSEADLAQAQRTHANILLSRMSEVRAQHRSELADLQAARSNGPDTESTLAHLRAKHEEVMSTALELNENKTHDDPLLQRTGTHEPQNLCSQLTQAQPDIDHHILKLPQEGPGAAVRQQVVKLQQQLADLQSSFDEEQCKAMKLEGQLVKASSNRQFLDGQLTDLQCRLKSTEQSKQDALAHVERLTVKLEANMPAGPKVAGSPADERIPADERSPASKSQPNLQHPQPGLQAPHVQAQLQAQQQHRSGLEKQSMKAKGDRQTTQDTGPHAIVSRLVKWEAKWAPGHPLAGSSEKRPAEESQPSLQRPQSGLQVPHI